MCTYARTIFSCSHVYWGRRLKTCTIAEDFQQGLLSEDCALRKPHGLKSTRLVRRCEKCARLDERLSVARRKLEDSRGVFEKKWSGAAEVGTERQGDDGSLEKHEDYGDSIVEKNEEHNDGSAVTKGGAQVTNRKDGAEAESGWIYSEDGEIKTRRVAEPKENRAFPEEQPEKHEKTCLTVERETQGAEESLLQTHAESNNIGGLGVSASLPSDTGSSVAAEDREYLVTGNTASVPETGLPIPDSPRSDWIKAAAFPAEIPVQQGGYAKASPRTTPRSRLALPVPRGRKMETAVSPFNRAQTTAADQVKQPGTREKGTPKSAPKSRLAVPVSKTPPRQVKATGTVSRLPRLGSFATKLVQPSSRALR
ncbi:hypothetical protein ACRE_056340 [Hapsidospora chrysogenum ATCC 11550]|uniref:Uncharacterized protein n=1 Tax=Hapsidospora chrysogenum (strain ATCC 11550 / CBS 779.69 / DSM 880 / IAM 14645 / JCM 23072 / IMI 49137) TaxID=857340 RepID=A0A086T2L3_HAPC1|nr:hypothetical protein ACRE_056340 [Hapsidospora chrysogenum ATCC 11550]